MSRTVGALPPERLTAEEASAALVALINGRPTTPSLDEIHTIVARIKAQQGGGPTHERVRDLLAQAIAVRDSVAGKSDVENDLMEARLAPIERQLELLSAQLPDPPKSTADLVSLAQLAAYWSDAYPAHYDLRPYQGLQDRAGLFLFVAGRLITSVLQLQETHHA